MKAFIKTLERVGLRYLPQRQFIFGGFFGKFREQRERRIDTAHHELNRTAEYMAVHISFEQIIHLMQKSSSSKLRQSVASTVYGGSFEYTQPNASHRAAARFHVAA